MRVYLLVISLFIYSAAEYSCKAQTPKQEKQAPSPTPSNIGVQESRYEILKVNCSKDNKCVVFAYCDPQAFDRSTMQIILSELSIHFKKKKVVNVNLFDQRALAESYSKGARNLGGLPTERRGWYLKTEDREFLLFYPEGANKGEPVSLKLKNE